ncbi:MAG: MCE family protein [Alphaproteobacteria bacterium]|jgi:paraquat-inducible protein B|nr:MCE family protein [Alphaproteobacteria bacterium]
MSAQPNPLRIGAFVIGAVALILGGIVAFASADFFKRRVDFVAYFPGSVTGLREGAAVAFRGVPVGTVTHITARYDPADRSVQIPVYFELIEGSFDVAGDLDIEDAVAEVRQLIDAGLRAQLVPQSFVTGQLYVQLTIRPDTPADFRRGGDGDIVEVPTLPSTIDVLDAQLRSLFGSGDSGGFDEVVANLDRLASAENVDAVGRILANFEAFTETLGDRQRDLAALVRDGRAAVQGVDTAVADATTLVADARAAVQEVGTIAADLQDPETGLPTVVAGARDAAQSLARMADQINNAVAENRPGLRDFSEDTLPAIDGLVLDLEQLAQRLNRVAEQLERDPPGFFFGRRQREGIR